MRKKTVKRTYRKRPTVAEMNAPDYERIIISAVEPLAISTFSDRLEKATKRYETAIEQLIAKL